MTEKQKDETTSSTGEQSEPWGTLEDLLLASAVNRHGINNAWDSIADELRTRTHKTFSPHTCQRRYVDLTRRFRGGSGAGYSYSGDDVEIDVTLVRIVEELRKIRVEELKREVHRHDVSIVSLQLTVKRLEVERESRGEEGRADLTIGNGTGADVEPARSSPEKVDSVEAGRSYNESNSAEDEKAATTPEQKNVTEPGPVQSRSDTKPEINDNGSSPLGELSAKQQHSSDVQSSASLSKKKRRRFRGGGSSGDEVSPANKQIDVKSQPLIRLLEILRSHKHRCIFQCRLPTQESEKYRNVIRQHMDLDTVQSRIENGVYNDYHPKFYRDLLLIFTNALMFYRKTSPEHLAARELQKMVIDEVVQRTRKPIKFIQPVKSDPDPQHLEPVVKKPRSSTAMVVCRRRSSSSMQALSESMKKNDEHSNNKNNNSNNNNENVDDNSNAKSSNNKVERSKGDLPPKKVDSGGKKSNGSDQKPQQEKGTTALKKQGVAKFLKRIKQNSPSSQEKAEKKDAQEEEEEGKKEKTESTKKRGVNPKKGNREVEAISTSRPSSGRKGGAEKDTPMVTRRSGNNGRPPKRKVAMVSTPDSGKGGRSGEKSKKKPRR